MLGARRWAFLGSAAFVVILVGEALRHGELLVLALPLVCYLAVGFYFSPPKIELRVHRRLSEQRALSEEPVNVQVGLENIGAGLELIELADNVPAILALEDRSPQKIDTLQSGERVFLEYTVKGMRGLARWENISVTVTDTLGLFVARVELPCAGELLIVPTFERLEEILIRPRRTRIFSGQVKARVGWSGIEFFGVREYSPGDERRYINWKATARRNRPIINEFEQERVADVIILLDARERSDVVALTPAGVRAVSLFEHSVRAALALVHYFTVQGNRVGLLIYGNYLDWTWPGGGRWQRERLLRALAAAEKGDKAVFEDLERLPTKLLPAGSQLVFVGPLLESDAKTIVELRLRYEVLCIAPNPLLFEGCSLPKTPETEIALRMEHLRRRALLAQMRRVGIRVLDWDVTQPLATVVQSELGHAAWRAAIIRRGRILR